MGSIKRYTLSFPIQTLDTAFANNAASLYCWFRSCEELFITIFALTESAAKMRVADFTASGDLHPAPKNIPFSDR